MSINQSNFSAEDKFVDKRLLRVFLLLNDINYLPFYDDVLLLHSLPTSEKD